MCTQDVHLSEKNVDIFSSDFLLFPGKMQNWGAFVDFSYSFIGQPWVKNTPHKPYVKVIET